MFLQEETEKGDDEDDDEDSEEDSNNEVLAVFRSDSEDEHSHDKEDESDDMNAPQVYQGSAVTSRSGRQCRPCRRYQDFLA